MRSPLAALVLLISPLAELKGGPPVGWCAGGPKQTGGGRTNGKQGLEEYLISKTVSINLNN